MLFSSFGPCNSQVSVSDTSWEAFWTDMVPFKVPRLALCVASGPAENQGDFQVCQTDRRGPRTPLKKTFDPNLDLVFVEITLLTLIFDCEESTKYNWESDQTWIPPGAFLVALIATSLQAQLWRSFLPRTSGAHLLISRAMPKLGGFSRLKWTSFNCRWRCALCEVVPRL